MPQEDRNEYTGSINPSTGVRLPIGLLASFVLAVAAFLFARQNILSDKIETINDDVKLELERKANKADTKDRYTGKDSLADKALSQVTHEALRRELMIKFENLEKRFEDFKERQISEIDHLRNDVKDHVHRHKDIIHESAH